MGINPELNPVGTDWTKPCTEAFAITASGDDLEHFTRGLYLGVSGDVTVTLVGSGSSVTFVGLAAGIIHPIAITKLTNAGDATGILGVY